MASWLSHGRLLSTMARRSRPAVIALIDQDKSGGLPSCGGVQTFWSPHQNPLASPIPGDTAGQWYGFL